MVAIKASMPPLHHTVALKHHVGPLLSRDSMTTAAELFMLWVLSPGFSDRIMHTGLLSMHTSIPGGGLPLLSRAHSGQLLQPELVWNVTLLWQDV